MAGSESDSEETKPTEPHAIKAETEETTAPASPTATVDKKIEGENKLPEVQAKSGVQANSDIEIGGEVPPPSKITVVRSSKSQTDLPAQKPVTESQPAAPVARESVKAQINFAPVEVKTGAAADSTNSKPSLLKTEVSKENASAPEPETTPAEPQAGKSLVKSSPTLAADQKFLTENLSASRQDIAAANLESQRNSHTKLSLPVPDQPLPPPQAPPQFLGDGDQGFTKPADASRDRSQFGTASEYGGAPIALLTNVSKGKPRKDARVTPENVFQFIKNNLVACALTLSMVVLAALVLSNNKESKTDTVKSMDLSFITTGQTLEEVNQLINAKKYMEAQALCDKIIQHDPKYAEAYHSRGQVFMAMHRFREAADDFTTAESFNHRSVDIHIDRAAALFHTQDYEKAKREYDDVLVLDPKNAPAYFGKGLAEENLNMTKEALVDFQKTLELHPDYAAANEEIGTIYFSKGELAKAYDEYTKAIKSAPEVSRFYFNRANALKQDHQTSRAIADYCKAIQLDATSPEFFNNRGLLYLENNETAKAITDFSSAVDLDPNYTIAKHNLTLAQERLRR